MKHLIILLLACVFLGGCGVKAPLVSEELLSLIETKPSKSITLTIGGKQKQNYLIAKSTNECSDYSFNIQCVPTSSPELSKITFSTSTQLYPFISGVKYASLYVMGKTGSAEFETIPDNHLDIFSEAWWKDFYTNSTTLKITVNKGWKNKIKLIYE